MTLKRYIPTATPATAIKLDIDTPGLSYQKWGGEQYAKQGDWLVHKDGDTYTIDAATFAATYAAVPDRPGQYVKTECVWAKRAKHIGVIYTKEGSTSYMAGDWLVYNNQDQTDGYAMPDEEFQKRYRSAP